MATVWGVDSHHINVVLGDCAIHLLVKGQTNPVIEKAIFIDGGHNRSGTLPNLQLAIEKIKKRYNVPKGQQLKFDTVVITHWDSDHWRGFCNLVNADLKDQYEKTNTVPKQCRYFYYNDVGLVQTYLYCPNWWGKHGATDATKVKPRGWNFFHERTKVGKEWYAGYKAKLANKDHKKVVNVELERFCKLRVFWDPVPEAKFPMLGTELFTNEPLRLDADPNTITLSQFLQASVNPTDATRPGIFCVGVFRNTLGQNNLTESREEGEPVEVVNELNTYNNQISVATMVMWPQSGRLSHYFAGDADFETENKIRRWLQCTGKRDTVGKYVTTMKASHHGSATSSPTELLDQFNPYSVILPAGSDYGHPRWELIYYLHARWLLNAAQTGVDPSTRPAYRPLYPLMAPYWFAKDPNGKYKEPQRPKKIISPANWNASNTKAAKYIEDLKTLWAQLLTPAAASTTLSPYQQFVSANLTSGRTKLEWIIKDLANKWNYLSYILITDTDDVAAKVGDPTGTPTRSDNTLIYVRVTCRDNDEDGKIFVMKQYGNELEYHRIVNTPAVNASSSAASAAGGDVQRSMIPRQPRGPTEVEERKCNARGGQSTPEEGDPDDMEDAKTDIESQVQPPVQTLPVLEPVTPPAGTYTFYCSQRAGTSSGAALTGDLDYFGETLHNGVISIQGNPSGTAALYPLLPTDEWLCWWMDVFPGSFDASNFKAQATLTDLLSFQFELRVADGAALSFSTSSVNQALGLVGNPVPDTGIFAASETMIFGLQEHSAAINFTISQLFTFAGHDLPGKIFLDGLSDLTFSITPSGAGGDRNAVWFTPVSSYETVARLVAHGDKDAMTQYFQKFLKGFNVDWLTIITKKTSRWALSTDLAHVLTEPEVAFNAGITLTISGTDYAFSLTAVFKPGSLQMILDYDGEADALEAIVNWLTDHMPFAPPFKSWIDAAGSALPAAQLRRVTLEISDSNGSLTVTAVSVNVQVTLGLGNHSSQPDTDVACLLTYNWPHGDWGNLTGCLWPSSIPTAQPAALDPTYETYMDLHPQVPESKTLANTVNLLTLGGPKNPLSNVPSQFVPVLYQLVLQIDSSGISFNGYMATNAPDPSATYPTIDLDRLGVSARYEWGTDGGDPEYELEFEFFLSVNPPLDTSWPSCYATASVDYDNAGGWTITGGIEQLNVGTIASFFDSDTQSSVMQMMAKIEIKVLEIEYQMAGDQTSFDFTGIVAVGDLELDLTYHYDPSLKNFTATLGTTNTDPSVPRMNPTLQKVIDSICDGVSIPGFVGDIVIPSTAEGGLLEFNFQESKTAGYMFFIARVEIEKIEFAFVQLRHNDWDANTPPKRLLRISTRALDDMSVPVISTLTQPYKELDFIYVQDDSGKIGSTSIGFTFNEIENIINADLPTGVRPFVVKQTSQPQDMTAVALSSGAHFLIIGTENGVDSVALDYVFTPQSKPSAMAQQSGTTYEKDLVVHSQAAADDGQKPDTPPAMGAFKKSFGPLTISNIGLQYKSGVLYVLLDATFELGPIEFSLLGFGLGIDLANFHITDFPDPVPTIDGLGIQFDQPPLVLTGLFKKVQDMYYGGVSVEFAPYLFIAAGGYGTVDDTTTVFVFAQLEGPLVQLEFATLYDICGGFGYNSHLQYPTVAQVPSFPFIGDNMSGKIGSTPLDTITAITDGKWISAQKDSIWFAVGVKVYAFDMLSLDAVIVIQFNPNVTLGIFADLIASIPEDSDSKLAYVELGISATVDFDRGTLDVEGALAPSSYILDPNCHLTGGFALCFWFTGSHYAGDWVYTIGGYHQAFIPQPYYPVPDRLAISWSLDGALSITGQAYFAITPKVCMGGGLLQASLSLGPLGAWYDAYADFLINYSPFHFYGHVGVDVGVSFSLDLLFVTIYISVDIGADLYLTGPQIQGYVHVDFWVFGFDINFGPAPVSVSKATLQEFYNILLQQNQSTAPSKALTTAFAFGSSEEKTESDSPPPPTPTAPQHTLTVVSGLLPTATGSQKSSPTSVWQVRAATFSFSVASVFAFQSASLNGTESCTDPNQLYSKPMRLEQVEVPTVDNALMSTMTTEIERLSGESATPPWTLQPVMKNVPVALWGPYVSADDPLSPDNGDQNNHITTLLDTSPATKPHLIAVIIIAPAPTLADDPFDAFNAQAANQEVVSEPNFPALVDAPSQFLPEAPVTDPPAQWKNVQTYWENPTWGDADRTQFVKEWAQTLGWTLAVGKGLDLDPRVPEQTKSQLDSLYLAAPLLTVP